MSDYAQITFFAPKDALSSGNPSKLIKGTEVDPELSAISTAITSKYDSTDVADNATAIALVSDATLITPLKLKAALQGGTFNLPATATYLGSAIVNAARTLTAGTGLTGGGTLAADRTFSLDTANTRNTDHAGVTLTAGAGLTGGGDITASRTFDVGAGTGITVNPNDVALDTAHARNVDHSAVSISAGGALTGGGTIAANRTLTLDINATATIGEAVAGGTDFLLIYNTSTATHNKVTPDSVFSGISGAVATSRQIISGAGLTGGGDLTVDRTLAVGAGIGITVNADDVQLDTSHVRNVDHSAVSISGGTSLTGGGTIAANRTITLVNDSASPGNDFYYGTDSAGTKNFVALKPEKTAVKTADTSRSSTTTLANDPDLTLAVAANKRYLVRGVLLTTVTTGVGAGGPKFQLSVPAAATAQVVGALFDSGTTNTGIKSLSSSGVFNDNFNNVADAHFFEFQGYIQTGANAGNIVVQWAQQISSGNAVNLLQNSYITLKELG